MNLLHVIQAIAIIAGIFTVSNYLSTLGEVDAPGSTYWSDHRKWWLIGIGLSVIGIIVSFTASSIL